MNATTVRPSVTIPKTSAIATATSANSPTPTRIDEFVKRHLKEAASEGSSAIIASATAAAKHGFTTSANSRYAVFLEAFRSNPRLSSEYAERYPACCFLSWAAFHAIRAALNLWCDLPNFYAGAVPPEQIPWMDVFELEKGDSPEVSDICDMAQLEDHHREVIEALFTRYTEAYRPDRNPMSRRLGDMFRASQQEQVRVIEGMYRQFQKSFFVVAPPDAFTVQQDFIKRFRNAMEALGRKTVAPDDPLVVKPCRGGVLVVAAWGDEAAFLNEAVKELNL